MLSTGIQVNYDHGVLPAAADLMMHKFKVEAFQFGCLGSLVYVGIVIGAITGSRLFADAINIKPTLLIATALNAILCLIFGNLSSFGWICIVKLIMGYF